MNNIKDFLEQPRRGKTREAQVTPHKAKPQCGAWRKQSGSDCAEVDKHKAKPKCEAWRKQAGSDCAEIDKHKAKPQCGARTATNKL